MNEQRRQIVRQGHEPSDRLVTKTDLLVIQAEALERYTRSRFVDLDTSADMAALMLSVGAMEWLTSKQAGQIFWPTSDTASATFAYGLLQQMSRQTSEEGAIFGDLARACMDLAGAAANDPDSDAPCSSFFAGLAWGHLGRHRAETVADAMTAQVKAIEVARNESVAKRRQTMDDKKQGREEDIRAFAAAQIRANPFVSDRNIQALYRRDRNLPANSSNAEAKVISNLRAGGRLPKRQMMVTDDQPSQV